jgi:hypothetical protein
MLCALNARLDLIHLKMRILQALDILLIYFDLSDIFLAYTVYVNNYGVGYGSKTKLLATNKTETGVLVRKLRQLTPLS